MEPSVSAPLCAVGPPWSVPLTLYLCKAFLSVLSGWPGGAGAGSLLSLCGWPGGSLPSQWTGEQETFGVGTSGLVNICIVFFFFLTMEGRVSPHSKTGPLLALGTFSIPCPLPGGPAKASHIQAKALCALSRNHPHLRWAQQRAPQLPNRKEDPIQFPLPLPLRPSPLLCDCQEMKGCSSPPPLFCSRGVGLGRPDFCSCPQPALTLLCLDLHLSQDFLRTKNKQTKN